MGKTVKPKAKPPRSRRSLLFINFLLLLIPIAFFGYRPLLGAVGRFLVVDEVPQSSDAIVILAGGEPGRALKAADLYQRRLAPVVVITTERQPAIFEVARKHGVELVPSYENYARMLRGYGVPDPSIERIEPGVADTLDELTEVREFARAKNWKRLIIVTSNFHTRRSRMVCRYVLEPAIHCTLVASDDSFRPEGWWTSQDQLRTFAVEMEKLVSYAAFLEPRLIWRSFRS